MKQSDAQEVWIGIIGTIIFVLICLGMGEYYNYEQDYSSENYYGTGQW